MYKRILVTIDGSHAASLALAEAIEIAGGQGTEIPLVHVIDERGGAAGDVAGVNLGYEARILWEAGKALLDEGDARTQLSAA